MSGRRTRALLAELSRAQPAADLRVMVWTTSVTMSFCGLYIAVASLLRTGATPPGAPFWVAASAALGGVVILAFRRHYRTWHYHLVQPATAVAVAVGIHLDGGGTASVADASLLVLLAALASFFFPWRTAAAHIGVSSVLLVVVLAESGAAAGDVLVLTCTTLAVGALVGVLSRVTAHAVLDAELDVLTGLPNRRGTERLVVAALAAHRPDLPQALAVVDLDHFKQVNDTLGHAAGDELLRRAAAAWTAQVPPGAVLGRWGGDEFVLLAPLDPHRLAGLVDALRSALPAGRSCTAGVTGLTAGDHLDAALSRADQALYAAKREGRGRTRVWSPPDAADAADAAAQPWLESQPSMRSDSGSSGSSCPEPPSSGASSRSMPTAAI